MCKCSFYVTLQKKRVPYSARIINTSAQLPESRATTNVTVPSFVMTTVAVLSVVKRTVPHVTPAVVAVLCVTAPSIKVKFDASQIATTTSGP